MSANDKIKKLLTAKELMQILRITETTFIRHKKNGRIPYVRIGKSYRYDLNDVINFGKKKGGSDE